ncbi:MAG: hypothetical protein MUF46_04745 [Desulfobacterales bacterium]|nr:hypothetical protein [Desulfobacterales bacterium]
MKITAGEAIPIRIPLTKPFEIASGRLTHSNHVLVRLTDDAGRVGWGETTTFLEVYGYDQGALQRMLADYLIPGVIGLDPRDPEALHARMERIAPFNRMAKAGIDLAAHDLAARAEGLPLHALLGGRRADRVPLIGVVDILPPEAAARSAAGQAAQGFRTIKIKIGRDADADIRRVESVRAAVGGEVGLRVDGNCGYDRDTALAVISRMEACRLEWIEQPLPRWDLEGMAWLGRRVKTPLAADESVASIHDAERVIAMGAAAVINIKLPKCGGIFPCRRIAARCREAGVSCFLGGCLETSPGTAAGLHVYAATPALESAVEIGGIGLYVDDVVSSPLVAVNGALAVPDSPGIGVAIDAARVARYRIA